MNSRPIEHRLIVPRSFDEVCDIIDLHTEALLQAATAAGAQRAVELVHADAEPLPGFDASEPVTVFLIDPDRNSEYQAFIDFRWTADPTKRLLANTRARLELRPHPDRRDATTELILRAHYEPSPNATWGDRVHGRGRRIVTAALERFLQAAATYVEDATIPTTPAPAPVSELAQTSTPAPPANDDRSGTASTGVEGQPTAVPASRPTMKRFRQILFASLGTANRAPAALDDAVALADRNDASLTVLGIAAAPPAQQRGLRLPGRRDRIADVLAAELTARLDAWTEPYTGNDITVHVEVGDPPVDIVRYLIANEHDLLIVAGDNADSAATIRRLLRLCPAPVWVLRPGHEGGRVLAAVDPDDDPHLNDLIVQLAQSQAQLRDGELHVAHAWELHGETILASSEYLPVPGPLLAQLAEQTETAHRRAFRDTIERSGIGPHHQHVVNGTPTQAIIGLLHLYRIDLLVMGSIGRAGIEGIVIGNTAESLFAKVLCSVLVLKPPGFESPIRR